MTNLIQAWQVVSFDTAHWLNKRWAWTGSATLTALPSWCTHYLRLPKRMALLPVSRRPLGVSKGDADLMGMPRTPYKECHLPLVLLQFWLFSQSSSLPSVWILRGQMGCLELLVLLNLQLAPPLGLCTCWYRSSSSGLLLRPALHFYSPQTASVWSCGVPKDSCSLSPLFLSDFPPPFSLLQDCKSCSKAVP